MKKVAVSMACISAIALTLFVVSCSKKDETTPTNPNSVTSQTTGHLRDDIEIPANPETPPEPGEIVSGGGGYDLCLSYTCREDLNSACGDEWGLICNWNYLLCAESNAAMTVPDLSPVVTGIVYVKAHLKKAIEPRDISGKQIIAADNINLESFKEALSCDAVYLLKGTYTYLKGNIVVFPLYIVNHKK